MKPYDLNNNADLQTLSDMIEFAVYTARYKGGQ